MTDDGRHLADRAVCIVAAVGEHVFGPSTDEGERITVSLQRFASTRGALSE